MNYTPEMVARRLDRDCAGFPRHFITPAIVADVMRAEPTRFGYLVCGWPSTEQQREIHRVAVARKYGCPEPSFSVGDYGQLYRDSTSQGFRGIVDEWHGFTPAGHVMGAGVDFGKFWRLDDPRPIIAVGG